MQKSHHRLKEVSLSTSFTRECQKFELLRRFAEIPSVRKISGFRLCDLSWMEPKAFSGGTICPGIKEIHLESSSISYKTFENLLQHVKALKILYYEQGTVADPQYDPRDTIRLLECIGSETLETLTLVDPYSYYLLAVSNEGIMSLRGFRVLKHVALDCYFFINHDKEYAEALRLAKQGCYPDIDNMYDISVELPMPRRAPDKAVSKLVDVLPESLETLELHRPMYQNDLTLMFENFYELRKERLPNLKRVSLPKGNSVNCAMKKTLKEFGIKFSYFEDRRTILANSSCGTN
ncbi:MAG: hypothetical protein Q9192_005479 [Flavoplaca navasiana]